LLASRLDQIAPEERTVLQHAAIIGRRFSHDALVALAADESDISVDDHLRSLAQKGFIRPGRTADSLAFHHVLVRNVTYLQVPKGMRAAVHQRFAEWVAGQPDSTDELVGYHLEQAYYYSSELEQVSDATLALGRRAAAHLASAGQRGADRDDWHAAANLLARAIDVLPTDDAERPPLLARLGEAFVALGDFASATGVLEEAITSARALDDEKTAWRARIELSLCQRTTDEEGWLTRARQDAETAIALFEELGDDRGVALAWRFASWIDQWNGHYAAAVTSLERALEHARRAGDVSEQKRILGNIGPNLVFGPELADAAADRLGRELRLADSDGRLALGASLRRDLGALHAMGGRFEDARAVLTEAAEVLTELDLVSDYGLTTGVSAYVEALAGNFAAAERDYRAARAIFAQTGENCRRLTAEVELAHTLVRLGQEDEALELTEIAEREVPADEFYCHALWRTARAKALARRGKVAEAEQLGREALELVEPTDDLATHAGVLTDLAEVVGAAGRGAEATQLAQKALDLYKRKGNLVLAGHALALLDALSTTTVAL
jgi:tetratricopeptide (TPR) repeat protein